MSRWIIHADLDAFFASVEQLDNPELRGRPVVVGGPPQSRGVVAAASYEARAFGIRSALPMVTALRLCPEAVRVPPRFERYGEISRLVMDIFRRFTPLVEPISVDEAFLDVTEAVQKGHSAELSSAEAMARAIKEQVRQEVGLTVSVGLASSLSVAKIASDMEKPDGLVLVPPGTEREFLAPLPVRSLWGVGPKTAERLAAESITTIGDLAERTEEWVRGLVGERGVDLIRLARGIDDSSVVVERETKSVSSETTFARDIGDPRALEDSLRDLARETAERLQRHGLKGRTVRVKLRLADFTTFTRQTTLAHPTDAFDTIHREAARLLARELIDGRRFRLLGVGVSSFAASGAEGQQQPALFSLDEP
ncbi:MAG TPA: DNA polymerase IV [Dehalococcoidia bacterium]|nr:DNA polymerase IV [Dehalococcoidia bacterium]